MQNNSELPIEKTVLETTDTGHPQTSQPGGSNVNYGNEDLEKGKTASNSQDAQKQFSQWLKRNLRIGRQAEEQKPKTTLVKPLKDYPPGYPLLAALHSFDENFMVYRKFGVLQAQVLLYKQNELMCHEAQLEELDVRLQTQNPDYLHSLAADTEEGKERKAKIDEIEKTLKEYAQLISTARDLSSFNPPRTYNYLNIKSLFDNTKKIDFKEKYIYYPEDLVSLKPGREHSWLDDIVERTLHKLADRTCKYISVSKDRNAQRLNPALTSKEPIWYIFASAYVRENAKPARRYGVNIFSKKRIEFLVTTIIMAAIVILMAIPIYVLSVVTDRTISIVTLGAFTVLFSIVLRSFTPAKRHEILASAAAYCAVLVVFVGNLGQKDGH